jgi:acetoin utilization protein AcuC
MKAQIQSVRHLGRAAFVALKWIRGCVKNSISKSIHGRNRPIASRAVSARAFIYSEAWRQFQFPEGHPWKGERAHGAFELASKLDLFRGPDVFVLEPQPVAEDALTLFHPSRYLDMLKKANRGQQTDAMLRHGLGTLDCPIFPGVYDYAKILVGGSLLAADLLERNEVGVAFSVAAGLHHGGPDFAEGFCYLNDICVVINRLLRRGKRVLYVDIDAHHGDQVQAAYWRDPRVLTISFHESTRTLFPGKGGEETEIGEGRGKGYCVNVPLLENSSDEEFELAFEAVFPPLVELFRPDIVVAQLGVDTHYLDSLSHLRLTNISYAKAVRRIVELSPRLLAMGGGGYNPLVTSRGWALAWALMRGLDPDEHADGFGGMFWGDSLASLKDRPQFIPDDLRLPAREHARRVAGYIEEHVFPLQESAAKGA